MRNKIFILIILWSLLPFFYLSAQETLDISEGVDEKLTYNTGTPFVDEEITFISNNKVKRYDSYLFDRGLFIENGLSNTITNTIKADKSGGSSSLYSCPVIHVNGSKSIFKINGDFLSDNGESYSTVTLFDTATFILGADAFVDVINEAYFTRQIWVWSDGTGTFEIEEGFIADRTNMATTPEGCGSLRFNKCNVVTHSTQNLPLGYRPNETTGEPAVNAHFVFEEQDSSVWKIKTNPQEYIGGLWIDASMVVETQADLEISGVKEHSNYSNGGSYDNWGGVMIRNQKSLTKRGAGKLILSGDHGYDIGSKMIIEEGRLEFQSDPFTYTDNAGYQVTYKGINVSSPNLIIRVENGIVHFNNSLCRIDSIGISPEGKTEIGLTDTLESRKASWGGTLKINIPGGITLNQGDTFKIFNVNNPGGSFSSIQIDDFSGDINWDLSSIHTDGVIKVASGSTTTKQASVKKQYDINIYPNPSYNHQINFQASEKLAPAKLLFFDLTGTQVMQKDINSSHQTFMLDHLSKGAYILKIHSKNKVIYHEKMIIQ